MVNSRCTLDGARVTRNVALRFVLVLMLLLGLLASMFSTGVECEVVERDQMCEACDRELSLEPPAARSLDPASHEIVFAEVIEPPPGPCGPDVFHPPRWT